MERNGRGRALDLNQSFFASKTTGKVERPMHQVSDLQSVCETQSCGRDRLLKEKAGSGSLAACEGFVRNSTFYPTSCATLLL